MFGATKPVVKPHSSARLAIGPMNESNTETASAGGALIKWVGGIAATIIGAVILFYLIGPGGILNPSPAPSTSMPVNGISRFELESQLLERANRLTCQRYRESQMDDYDPM